ncbi:sulfotransferase [Limibaculum sp. FT325]|uniref:sulfotransferase family protein n=1 Tax=Thermohalobaculum sediminis TaxID=2939436 RepID=UPI0020C0C2D7|nr:sulfotransferase [Limibaculum sediminis]MCL5775533.1 sulfotransferase [Limibaculum sediminis]
MAHPLSGADLGTLRRVFADGGRPDRWGTAAAIWGAALGRLPFTLAERALIGPRLPRVEDMAPPVFILGHWRSGTTHLYNLMSLGAWGYVPPVAVGLPHDMFGLARLLRPLLERQLPATRYIDNIPVTPTSPQEDEIAIANMSPLSFYHGIYFPRAFDRMIDRGLFFDGCSPAEIEEWAGTFTYFMRKLARDQGRPLLIKNPVYTARPAMLRRLFPGAKFIHIHRNPHEVFLSMRNFYRRLLSVMALQDIPPEIDIDATILRVYDRMMRVFVAETEGWEAPEFVEIPYARLDVDPMGVLAEVHETLDLPGFELLAPRARSYLAGIEGYEKNSFRGDAAAIETVEHALAPWLARWGYTRPPLPGRAA